MRIERIDFYRTIKKRFEMAGAEIRFCHNEGIETSQYIFIEKKGISIILDYKNVISFCINKNAELLDLKNFPMILKKLGIKNYPKLNLGEVWGETNG